MFADIYKIYAVAFVAALSFNVLSPILPEVSRAFQLERMEGLVQFGGLNNLLLFLPMGILSLLYAIVGNRIRIPLSLVALVLSLVLFWIYISQSTLSFTLGYLFLGSTLGLLIPGLYAVARGLPNAPPFATSININIMIGIGLAVGQYASALIAQSFSWRLVYLVLACISILICPVLALSMPSQNLIAERFNINKIPRRAWLLLAQYLPGSVPWGGFSVFIFSYMETDCGISKASAVFLVTILGVGMIAGSFVAGRLGSHLSRKGFRAIVLVIMVFFLIDIGATVALIEATAVVAFPWLVAMYFISGLLLSVPGSYIKGMLFESASTADVQTIFSVENFLESVGKGLGPFIVALLIQGFVSLKLAIVASVFFWLLCLPPLLLLLQNKNDRT